MLTNLGIGTLDCLQKKAGRLGEADRRNQSATAPPAADLSLAYLSLANLHGAPAITDAFDPNLALAPIATGRQLGIAWTRRRIIRRRRRRGRIVARRRRIVGWRRRIVGRRRRIIGDGAADNGAGGNAAKNSSAH